MVIHFICRGNVFRSLIAEAYVRSLQIPNLTVHSSGTVAGRDKEKNLINFPKILGVLKDYGVGKYAKEDYGDDINQELLDKSDIIVFLNRRAYDEARQHFVLPNKILIWDVADIDDVGRPPENDIELRAFIEAAYDEITKNVDNLRKLEQF